MFYSRPRSSEQDVSAKSMPLNYARKQPADNPTPSGVPEITVQALEQLYDAAPESLILVDVRFPHESAIAHLPGALLVPFSEIYRGQGVAKIQSALTEWQQRHPNQDYRLVIYCTAGVRSATIVSRLQAAGLSSVNLAGGMNAWHKLQETQKAQPDSVPSSVSTNPHVMKPISPPRRIFSFPRIGWLSAGLGFAAIAVGVTGWYGYRVVHQPDKLRPLLQAGVPLHLISGLPVLGEAVQAAALPQISVQQLKQTLDRQANQIVLLDVRSPKEYKDNSLPGAVLVPIEDIEAGKGIEQVRSLAGDRKLVVYCTTGYRSGKALLKLQKAGIDGVQVQGGFAAWVSQQYPLVPQS